VTARGCLHGLKGVDEIHGVGANLTAATADKEGSANTWLLFTKYL